MNLNRVLIGSVAVALAGNALAQTTATATITQTGLVGGVYSYDIDLLNTGSTGIQTFWFAWVPGLNFMPDMPTSVGAPASWTDVTTGPPGYAIQYKTSGGLAAGNSLDGFNFSSVDSPTVLEGSAGGTPILTSFVYSGQPLFGTSNQFVVAFAPAPEPATWLALAGFGLIAIAKRRRRISFEAQATAL
ncbi:MAG: PEP-CTERM sorting domain-containing protein [Fimbriimonadaceae bacterium]